MLFQARLRSPNKGRREKVARIPTRTQPAKKCPGPSFRKAPGPHPLGRLDHDLVVDRGQAVRGTPGRGRERDRAVATVRVYSNLTQPTARFIKSEDFCREAIWNAQSDRGTAIPGQVRQRSQARDYRTLDVGPGRARVLNLR